MTDARIVDTESPSSAVEGAQTLMGQTCRIEWNGDGGQGSAVATCGVCISVDSRPYSRWQGQTRETHAGFEGRCGHTYSFACRATDRVANVEDPPDEPDLLLETPMDRGWPMSFDFNCGAPCSAVSRAAREMAEREVLRAEGHSSTQATAIVIESTRKSTDQALTAWMASETLRIQLYTDR